MDEQNLPLKFLLEVNKERQKNSKIVSVIAMFKLLILDSKKLIIQLSIGH